MRQMRRKRRRAYSGWNSRETAKKAEILSFLTEVMRDEEEADLKTRMKAAELLGKRESLFEKKTPTEKESRVIIVDDLP